MSGRTSDTKYANQTNEIHSGLVEARVKNDHHLWGSPPVPVEICLLLVEDGEEEDACVRERRKVVRVGLAMEVRDFECWNYDWKR